MPDLSLTEEEQKTPRKIRNDEVNCLKEHRPGLFNRLLLFGKRMGHVHEIDAACHARLNQLIPQMKEAEGVTETMKLRDRLEWRHRMNRI